MALLTAIGMGIGALGAGAQFFQGAKLKKEADAKLAQFRHQELTNLAENLKPSLEAERQARISEGKMLAGVTDVAQGMDAASAMAMMQSGLGQVGEMSMKTTASQMEKEFQVDAMKVEEEKRLRDIVEARKMEELSSLKQQKMAGMQMQSSAFKDLGSLALSGGIARDQALSTKGVTTYAFSDKTKVGP
jgi:hypothetical protein